MTSKTVSSAVAYGTYTVTAGQAPWAWVSGNTAEGIKLASGVIPLTTRNQDDIELETKSTWNSAIVCVDSLMDLGSGYTEAKLQMPYGAIAQRPGWGSGYKTGAGQTIYNVFEYLNEPGEFYFDKTAGKLYYCPRSGEDLNTADVVVPKLDTLINMQGNNTTERVHNLTFEGLSFAYSDWDMFEVDGSYGKATVQGATGIIAFADGNWHNSIYRAYDVGPGAVMASSAQNISILNCTIAHTGNDGLSMVNDVTDSNVTGNTIYDLGGSAFVLGHPQHMYIGDKDSSKGDSSDKEKYEVNVEGVCKNINFTNNYMHTTSKLFIGDAGIMIFAAEDLNMQYNYLANTPYTGLSLGWGWCNMNGNSSSVVPDVPTTTTKNNMIKNNTLVNSITTLGDGGAIYTLGDMPGTVISENYILNVGTPDNGAYHVRGIHVDEGTQHVYGEKNVIVVRPDLSCIDCGNWGYKGNNTWDNNYATTSSYTTTGTYEPGTVITDKHTYLNGILPKAAFDIAVKSGIQGAYLKNISTDVFNMQDRFLNSDYSINGNTDLNLNITASDIDGELWLAPEGTQTFTASEKMTKCENGIIKTPADAGTYRMFFIKDGIASSPSAGSIIVNDDNLVNNVSEGTSYKTSKANPFAIDLNEAYVEKATLNGTDIVDGYKINTEGSQELVITDLNGSIQTITFTTYIELVDKVFDNNASVSPGNKVNILSTGNENNEVWFVSEDVTVVDNTSFVEGDNCTKAASGSSNYINAPKTAGKYKLYIMSPDKSISNPSEATLTVINDGLMSNGLLLRFNAQDNVELDVSGNVLKCTDLVSGLEISQSNADKRPQLVTSATGMNYFKFDGVDDELSLLSSQSLNLNGKSQLSIVLLSAYTGTDPNIWTYGDTKTALYFGESGGWGSIYLAPYSSFICARFGSGQSDNYLKSNRASSTNAFTVTSLVKDGTTEYLYDGTTCLKTETGKYSATAQNKATFSIGYTASSAKDYFPGNISEVLIYDRALTASDISSINDYMQKKLRAINLKKAIDNAEVIMTEESASNKYSINSWDKLSASHNSASQIYNELANYTDADINIAILNLDNAINNMTPKITEIPSEDLNLWLKADDGVVTNDGKVIMWKDMSGAGNNATVALNPVDGEVITNPSLINNANGSKPAVSFNGISDGMQFPFSGIDENSEITIVIVASSKLKQGQFGGDNNPLLYFHEYNTGWSKLVVTPTQTTIDLRLGNGISGDGGFYRYQRLTDVGTAFTTTMVVKQGATETLYVGDQQVWNRDNAGATFKNVMDEIGYLCRYPVSGTSSYSYNESDISEIMIYNRALPLTEIQSINSYLQEKYKILVNSIKINAPENVIEMEENDTLTLTATILPEEAAKKEVHWSVVNADGTATTNAIITSSGVLTAVSAGKIKVIAAATDGSGITDEYELTILPAEHEKYNLQASAGEGGSITPGGTVGVVSGSSITYTITANANYKIKDVLVDGISIGAVFAYTFDNIVSDHNIQAIFEKMEETDFVITANAGEGGSITPGGTVGAVSGSSITYTITANTNYKIKDVLVDGISIGAVPSYTFDNIVSDHNIQAIFEKEEEIYFTITASTGGGGIISPSGTTAVVSGSSITYTISAASGYEIYQVLVDGVSKGNVSSYTFVNITSEHTIQVIFVKKTYEVSIPIIQEPVPKTESVQVNSDGVNLNLEFVYSVNNDILDVILNIKNNDIINTNKKIVIPVTTDTINKQVSNENISKINITVGMPDYLLDNSSMSNLEITLDLELLKKAGENTDDIKVTVKNEDGRERYSWSFSGEDIKNSKQEITDINLALTTASISNEELMKLLGTEFVPSNNTNNILIDFAHEGILASQASVKIYVGNLEGITPKLPLYLYHLNTEIGKLETLPYSSTYTVDEQGYITVNILHCSDYVLTLNSADSKLINSLLNQITVTSTENTIYYKGTKNATAKIAISLPSTLEMVNSLKDKTSSNAIGGVTVTYASSNSKIAVVDKYGNITARGIGKVTINTTVTLYSGKTKSYKTVISVKKPYIEITKKKASMKIGESVTFTAKAYGLDNNNIKWSTAKKSVVIINKTNGKATAVSKGTDYVTANVGGTAVKIKVVVK